MKEEKISKVAMVQAVFKKLKWLNNHFNQDGIDEVSFHKFTHQLLRVDCEFKSYKPGNPISERGSVRAHLGRRIVLISKDGKLIGQVGAKILPAEKKSYKFLIVKWTNDIPARTTEIFPETVGEALKRLDPKNETYYVVGTFEEKGKTELAITKPANGSTINASLEADMVEAELKIAEALDLK